MGWMRGVVLSVLVGCGPTIEDADTSGSASGTDSSAATTNSPGSSEGSTSSASLSESTAAPASTSGSTSTGAVCQGFCFVDFPCNGGEDSCLDRGTIQRYETIDCVEAIDRGLVLDCDRDCCDGSTCAAGPTESCEPDTSCVETARGPECRRDAELCNDTDLRCGEMQFCEFAPRLCPNGTADLGVCVDLEGECPEPENDEAECGCDGETYVSACERRNAGVALDYPGPCFLRAPVGPGVQTADR